jgi:nucleotide-binding universal stress UspA family protein
MSLLVATNFSEAARKAAGAAARMAARTGTLLRLAYVEPEGPARAFGEAGRGSAERALAAEAERLRALGARVEWTLLTGPLHEALAQLAEASGAELLVTGEPPEATTSRWVGGSLDRLLLGTRVPLLVVKDPAPFEAWMEGQRLLRVVLGVDRTGTSAGAAAWLRALRRYGPLEVVAVHVCYVNEEARRMGLPPPARYDALEPALRGALEAEVRALASPSPELAPVQVRLVAGLGRPAEHLLEAAEEARADLLVVGSHQRRALGKLWSVSHVALRLAPVSVACVPLGAGSSEAEAPAPRRMLAATDFSPPGNRAVAHALALLPPGGTLHLLHVGEAPPSPEAVRELEGRLRALVPRSAQQRGLHVVAEAVAADGEDVAARIAQAAARHDVDLLCLGSHGRSGVRELLLGSVTRAVMGRVRRPVLVVPAPEP